MIFLKTIFFVMLIFLNSISFVLSNEITQIKDIKKIEVDGNIRISDETVLLFADLDSFETVDQKSLNQILKNIYNSNFFENVSVNLITDQLFINVSEKPLIENLSITGIKSKTIKNEIQNILSLKNRSSYDQIIAKSDRTKILEKLRSMGYFFSEVDIRIDKLNENKLNIEYFVNLKDKTKIKKISFIGNNNFKDRKLRNVIISEESKFWKFLSSKKFLNEELIEFDKRLIKNFYLNNGYYNAQINSSFAKFTDENNFELIFNIEENKKYYFDNIQLNLPLNFNQENFTPLYTVFENIKGEPYSLNTIRDINETLDTIIIEKEFESLGATVEENLKDNKINLVFNILDQDKYTIDRINIFGNNITQENVIRNQLIVDEGDIYNEILSAKFINNIKSLNIFKSVDSKINIDDTNKNKTIDIIVEEKPTGEILAGAGFGTEGATFTTSVKENNYLGKGIKLNTSITASSENLKGIFSIQNPNYQNSNKSVNFNLQAIEIDKVKDSGYKTNKYGTAFGVNYELFDDLFFGISTSSFVEKIETNNTASTRLKKQKGNYFDTFLELDFDFDKRNQKFETTKGYRSIYSTGIPLISENNTFKNSYSFTSFHSYFEKNITKYSFYVSGVNSISNDDVKLSDRLFLPSNRLRGFEFGRVGPKDGNDYVGGNYAASLNVSSTLPYLFENNQYIDALIFSDTANLWGIDYDSSIDDSNQIRSSIGIGLDWLTILGPLNFSLAAPISKANTDKTQNFRFNIGTTF